MGSLLVSFATVGGAAGAPPGLGSGDSLPAFGRAVVVVELLSPSGGERGSRVGLVSSAGVTAGRLDSLCALAGLGSAGAAPEVRVVAAPLLRAAIDSAAALADREPRADTLGALRFAVLDAGGAPRPAWVAICDRPAGADLLRRVMRALRGQALATRALAGLACRLGGPAAEPAGEETSRLEVRYGRFSYDPASRRLQCLMRVVNRSDAAIEPPLVIALGIDPPEVGLANGDGFTCRVHPPGSPYVILPLEGPLAPGASSQRLLEFENPRQLNLHLSERAFTGPVER